MVAQTMGSLFFQVALDRGAHKAIVSNEGTLSYGELLDRAQRIAQVLKASGVTPTCRVAILAENNPVFVSAVVAVSLVGAVFVPLNARWRVCEMERALEGAKCVALIFSDQFADAVERIKEEGYAPPLLLKDGLESCGEPARAQRIREAEGEGPFLPAQPDLTAPGALLFTGGTTGRSKGALLSHGSFVLDAIADSKDHLLYGPDSVFFSVAPLSHRAALSYLIKVLLSGGTFVMTSHFDARAFLDTVRAEGVTAAFIIPAPFVYKLAEEATACDETFPLVRVVMLGGTDVSASELQAAWRIFPNACVQRGYSHTENAAHTVERIYREGFDPVSFDARGIGRPRLYTGLKLCDEQGREVAVGQVGEAYASSPWQMIGYDEGPAVSDGWVRTGDLLQETPDGTFLFKGRVKELIKTGGELVFCAEVEDVVSRIPGVRDCAVFGRDDDVYGERVCVAVVPEEGAEITLEKIQAHCGSTLSGFKKPRELDLVAEIPVTNTGKVDRLSLSGKTAKLPR